MTSTSEQRLAFVEQCRRTHSVAYLDGTRDTYHTVVLGTRSSSNVEDLRELANVAGYTLATTWTTMFYRIYVFSTTPTDLPAVLALPDPPQYLIANVVEYFSDGTTDW